MGVSESEGRFRDGDLFWRSWVWSGGVPRALTVLSHGYAEHCGRYGHVASALAGTGCAVFALDHRGHGQSSDGPGGRADIGGLDGAVSDLDAFVDLAVESVPDVPVYLIGHSMGGLIAVAYAEVHQDRLAGLVTSGPAVAINPALQQMLTMDGIPELSLGPAVSRDPAVVADYEADPLNYHGPFPRPMLQTLAGIESVRDDLAKITIPLLALHGGADALVPPTATDDLVAGVSSNDVTKHVWPELFHEVFNEPEQDEVIGVVVDWIGARCP